MPEYPQSSPDCPTRSWTKEHSYWLLISYYHYISTWQPFTWPTLTNITRTGKIHDLTNLNNNHSKQLPVTKLLIGREWTWLENKMDLFYRFLRQHRPCEMVNFRRLRGGTFVLVQKISFAFFVLCPRQGNSKSCCLQFTRRRFECSTWLKQMRKHGKFLFSHLAETFSIASNVFARHRYGTLATNKTTSLFTYKRENITDYQLLCPVICTLLCILFFSAHNYSSLIYYNLEN